MDEPPKTISDKERRYLVFILSLYGMGANDIQKLWAFFKKIEDVRNGKIKDFIAAGLSPVKAKKLLDWFLMETPESQEALRQKYDVKIVTYFDNQFPLLLQQIPTCPYMLYYKGSLDALRSKNHLAVVGTRKPSSYGREVCQSICSQLVAHNVSIISGLAFGVDAIAHQCAVEAKKSTVAVLGHGLDQLQPRSNQKLSEEILVNGGALVSEYPIHVSALRQHFPARNRLVAGMSQGTLVIEGAKKSGSLITAKFAQEFKRKLFAIPGAVTNPMAYGPHNLIQNGARLVQSSDDILSELIILRSITEERSLFDSTFEPQNKLQQQLIESLRNSPKTIDELVRVLNTTAAEISGEIGILEIEGCITKDETNAYKLSE